MFPDIYYEIANQIGIYPLKENDKTAYVTKNDFAVLLYNTMYNVYDGRKCRWNNTLQTI